MLDMMVFRIWIHNYRKIDTVIKLVYCCSFGILNIVLSEICSLSTAFKETYTLGVLHVENELY